MKKLDLYEDYNREEIHDILSPHTSFVKSAGTWGLHGSIGIANTKDFVFIVTIGTIQGEHEFDEGFTEDGVFRWQSQPRNSLKTKKIIQLINHNEIVNNVYLFLRANKGDDYTYLGKLKYLDHDSESGQGMEPVNFNWQVLSWPMPEEILSKLDITLEKGIEIDTSIAKEVEGIQLTDAPEKKDKKNKTGLKKAVFKATKVFNNPEKDKDLKEIGNEGELSIIEYEKLQLKKFDKEDLIDKIVHVSESNDSAGYDILSYDKDGNQIFIEVKTTLGPVRTDFYISPGEIKFSKDNASNYYLYRVYNFNRQEKKGKLFIKKGNIEENFNLTPVSFKASI